MPVPRGTVRWCGIDQRSVELTEDGRCPFCGTQYIQFISDTGGPEYPGRTAQVQGNQITEEANMAPEAGQPAEQPAEGNASTTEGNAEVTETSGVEVQQDSGVQSAAEPAPVEADRPAEGSSAVQEQPNDTTVGGGPAVQDSSVAQADAAVAEVTGSEPAASSPEQQFVVVHGTVTGLVVGTFSRDQAVAYQNDSLQARPGQPIVIVPLQPAE